VDKIPDSEDKEGEDTSTETKRRRPSQGMSTRTVNKKLKDQLEEAIVRTVANTQDMLRAKSKDVAIDPVEQRYRSFAQHLPGAGIQVVGTMISRAASIATAECIRDWKTLLQYWRTQHAQGKRLFSEDVPRLNDANVLGLVNLQDATESIQSAEDELDVVWTQHGPASHAKSGLT
jgi:hypothetical protein